MSTVSLQSHPQFHVHDHHPMLRGLSVMVLCLAFVVGFVLSVMPGVRGLLGSPCPPVPEAGLQG